MTTNGIGTNSGIIILHVKNQRDNFEERTKYILLFKRTNDFKNYPERRRHSLSSQPSCRQESMGRGGAIRLILDMNGCHLALEYAVEKAEGTFVMAMYTLKHIHRVHFTYAHDESFHQLPLRRPLAFETWRSSTEQMEQFLLRDGDDLLYEFIAKRAEEFYTPI